MYRMSLWDKTRTLLKKGKYMCIYKGKSIYTHFYFSNFLQIYILITNQWVGGCTPQGLFLQY